MLLPSINIVFCTSATVTANCSGSACSLNALSTSSNTSLIPPPRAPITTGTIVILYPGLLSLNSNASCQYFVTFSFLLATTFACSRHAISQIQIFFLSLSFNTKSGLLDVVVLRKLNSKSQADVALLFSKTCPLAQFSLYHFVSFPTNPYSFAHAIAITINALLCHAMYSLLTIVLHPATRCSTISLNSWYSRHLPFSISPLATFHPLVSTICSITVIIDDVFLGVNLCFNQRWNSCSCLLYKSLCNSFCL